MKVDELLEDKNTNQEKLIDSVGKLLKRIHMWKGGTAESVEVLAIAKECEFVLRDYKESRYEVAVNDIENKIRELKKFVQPISEDKPRNDYEIGFDHGEIGAYTTILDWMYFYKKRKAVTSDGRFKENAY